MSEKRDIIGFVKNELAAEYVEESGNRIIFIWRNMEFEVDFDSGRFISSKWHVSGNIEDMKIIFDELMDNIEFTETYGVLDKKKSADLIWNRTGW